MNVASAIKSFTGGMLALKASPASDDAPVHRVKPAGPAGSDASISSSRWACPQSCYGCGAMKAPVHCIECDQSYCYTCAAGGQEQHVAGEGKGSCLGCSQLCFKCKPVACSFCCQDPPAKLCERCLAACDSCQRAACPGCASTTFSSCPACGYACCPDCSWQELAPGELEFLPESLGGSFASVEAEEGGDAPGDGGAGGGVPPQCWCSSGVPLGVRKASNSTVSSRRYQVAAQVHPLYLASSMEAAGLRDEEGGGAATASDYGDDPLLDFDWTGSLGAGGSWGMGGGAPGPSSMPRLGSSGLGRSGSISLGAGPFEAAAVARLARAQGYA